MVLYKRGMKDGARGTRVDEVELGSKNKRMEMEIFALRYVRTI
jgi:hypothetical protein